MSSCRKYANGSQYEQSLKQATCDFKIDRDFFEALVGFHSGPSLYPGFIGIWCVVFGGVRKTGEKPPEQGREPTTKSTHIYSAESTSNPGYNDGRRALLTMHHPCSPKSFN